MNFLKKIDSKDLTVLMKLIEIEQRRGLIFILAGVISMVLGPFFPFTAAFTWIASILSVIGLAFVGHSSYIHRKASKILKEKIALEKTEELKRQLDLIKKSGNDFSSIKPFVIEHLQGVSNQKSKISINGVADDIPISLLIFEVDNLTQIGKAYIKAYGENLEMIVAIRSNS